MKYFSPPHGHVFFVNLFGGIVSQISFSIKPIPLCIDFGTCCSPSQDPSILFHILPLWPTSPMPVPSPRFFSPRLYWFFFYFRPFFFCSPIPPLPGSFWCLCAILSPLFILFRFPPSPTPGKTSLEVRGGGPAQQMGAQFPAPGSPHPVLPFSPQPLTAEIKCKNQTLETPRGWSVWLLGSYLNSSAPKWRCWLILISGNSSLFLPNVISQPCLFLVLLFITFASNTTFFPGTLYFEGHGA